MYSVSVLAKNSLILPDYLITDDSSTCADGEKTALGEYYHSVVRTLHIRLTRSRLLRTTSFVATFSILK